MYLKLLESFYKWNPELVEKMNDCSHHYGPDGLSIWHAEGSVWAHTMLMYKDFLSNSLQFRANSEEMRFALAIAILCHDTGKVITRIMNEDKKRATFHGHEHASIQPAVDFIYYLKTTNQLPAFFTNEYVYKTLNIISNHMDYYRFDDEDAYTYLANKGNELFILGKTLSALDKRNSLDKEYRFLDEKIPKYMYVDDEKKQIPECNIVIWCGVPASGKDCLAERAGGMICSYDNARIDLFKKAYPHSNIEDQKLLHNQAWDYARWKQDELDALLKAEVEAAVATGWKVHICNTSRTRKSRRRLASLFSKHKMIVVYVVAPTEIINMRNKGRATRTVPANVMEGMFNNQQIPSMWEFKGTNNVVGVGAVFND